MTFDMGAAWNHAVELMKGSFKLQVVIAGLFILVPSAIVFLTMPGVLAPAADSADPFGIASQDNVSTGSTVLGFILSLIQMIGLIAILALMDRSRPTVGQSLGIAARSLPTLIGVAILLVIAFMALMIPIGLVLGVGMLGAGTGGGIAGMGAVGIVIFILAVIAFLYLYTRFSMIMPIVVLGGERNVFSSIKDGWKMTSPVAWRLLGFFVLLAIAAFVISIPVGLLVAGASAAGGGAGTVVFLALLVNLVISAILNIILMAVLAAVFYQLSGTSAPDIAETFE